MRRTLKFRTAHADDQKFKIFLTFLAGSSYKNICCFRHAARYLHVWFTKWRPYFRGLEFSLEGVPNLQKKKNATPLHFGNKKFTFLTTDIPYYSKQAKIAYKSVILNKINTLSVVTLRPPTLWQSKKNYDPLPSFLSKNLWPLPKYLGPLLKKMPAPLPLHML